MRPLDHTHTDNRSGLIMSLPQRQTPRSRCAPWFVGGLSTISDKYRPDLLVSLGFGGYILTHPTIRAVRSVCHTILRSAVGKPQ